MSSADSGCRRRAESPTIVISLCASLANLHCGTAASVLIGGIFCHIMIRYDGGKQGTRRLGGCVEPEIRKVWCRCTACKGHIRRWLGFFERPRRHYCLRYDVPPAQILIVHAVYIRGGCPYPNQRWSAYATPHMARWLAWGGSPIATEGCGLLAPW